MQCEKVEKFKEDYWFTIKTDRSIVEKMWMMWKKIKKKF